jgi:hypothetical protein
VRPHNAITAYLLNQGAFNVNSISIDAWRTLLAGLRGAAVDHFNSLTTLALESSNDKTPFPRTTLQGANSSTGSDAQLWNGFRSLTDTQIKALAEAIVAEVKNRARNRTVTIKGTSTTYAPRPFTTLSEFINRRLTAYDATYRFSQSGALQAALDNSINLPEKNSLSAYSPIAAETNFTTLKYTGNGVETVTTQYDNREALAAATIAGAPQWLSQADLLERIGPQLSARSDTFTVRTYGESVNPATGEVQGRAWLEAVVQRDSAYVESTVHPAIPVSALTAGSPSEKFGRRFKVVSFRWLTPTDI